MNIATWNMQGSNAASENKWNTGVNNICHTTGNWRPELVCLQECGSVPESSKLICSIPIVAPNNTIETVCVFAWTGTTSRPGMYIIHHQWDTLGNRVNTAIVLNSGTPPQKEDIILVWPAGGATHRPALGVKRNNIWIFSFHAISPGGQDSTGMLAAIDVAAGLTSWAVFADWNREPVELLSIIPNASVICPPNQRTYPTSPLPARSYFDYCVMKTPGGLAVVGEVLSLILSDHFAVSYIL